MGEVEVLQLYELETEGPQAGKQRGFDAADGDGGMWQGCIRLELGWEDGPRLYVCVDREDPLGDSYACRPGRIEEVTDDILATKAITRALTGMPTSRIKGIITVTDSGITTMHEDGLY